MLSIDKDVVSVDMKWVKKKGANRRFAFLGWDNYTDFEREWIDKVKD